MDSGIKSGSLVLEGKVLNISDRGIVLRVQGVDAEGNGVVYHQEHLGQFDGKMEIPLDSAYSDYVVNIQGLLQWSILGNTVVNGHWVETEVLVRVCDEVGDKYRFGFNGMEKDNEMKGLGNSLDFGARMYDSRVGRWLSVDPLAAKYPGISTYVFVANNPLMFIDPDGRKIVDSKGNIAVIVAVDGNIVYTDFATPDIIEVIDAMKITKVGQNRVYEMIKHSNEIYIEIQNESPVYADPTVSITSSFFKPGLSLMFGSHKHVEMSDKQEIKSIITIYKKSIEKAIEDKIEHYMDNNFTVYFEYFSIQEHIGATGTHEAVHGTDKNSSRYYNAREPEKLPKSEEKIYYEQLKNEENANKNKNESLVPKN